MPNDSRGPMAAKRRWLQAYDENRRASEQYVETAKTAFPPGTTVRWRHGDHWRSGTVLEISGERLKVRSMISDKEYWIYLFDLVDEARYECGGCDA